MNSHLVEVVLKGWFNDYAGEEWSNWTDRLNREFLITDFAKVTAVEYREESDDDSYDSGYAELSLVFKVEFLDGTTKYYRKLGSTSSYNGMDWNGNFSEVNVKVKTVIEYL